MQVDASAKWPGLALFGSALFWLLLGGTLQLIAAIQLHTPTFLAECAWFTYGRLTPAAQNALVYGWGINAALGFGLWLMARLSATTLRHGGWLLVAIKFWNTGVALGVLGILGGYSTSFELLEMPRFVTLILLVSYAMIGVWAVTTFSIRNTENVFASQWYLFGAAFWFPWLYAIAQLMLLKAPVRGVLQPVVNAWFVHGLYGLWFVPVALAAAYYFLPKIFGKPIANYYLAPLAFWWLVIVTALAGGSRLIGAPVPVWIPTLGTVANFLLVVPVVIIGLNLFGTFSGRYSALAGSMTLRFILLGAIAFIFASILNLAFSLRGFVEIAQFTLLSELRDWVVLYACFSSAMFGAAYFILPRLTSGAWRFPTLVKMHLGATLVGVALLTVALGVGGWQQGHLLGSSPVAFGEITQAMTFWFTLRTAGFAVLLFGHLAFVINFVGLLCPLCTCCKKATADVGQGSSAEGHA